MAGRAARETVTLAGRAERARLARAFVEGVLGPGHPCVDVAALLVGELFAADPAVCRISAEPAAVTSGLCTPVIKSRTMALTEGDSIAYLAAQHLQAPEHGARLGAIGHGPNGTGLAERLCRHIDTWGADRAAKPSITIYPPDSAPRTSATQVITREHCEITVIY